MNNQKKECKLNQKEGHRFDKCLPQSSLCLLERYGSAVKYYKRAYTEEEKQHGRLTFERCRHCNKLKWGLVKEGEELNVK